LFFVSCLGAGRVGPGAASSTVASTLGDEAPPRLMTSAATAAAATADERAREPQPPPARGRTRALALALEALAQRERRGRVRDRRGHELAPALGELTLARVVIGEGVIGSCHGCCPT